MKDEFHLDEKATKLLNDLSKVSIVFFFLRKEKKLLIMNIFA